MAAREESQLDRETLGCSGLERPGAKETVMDVIAGLFVLALIAGFVWWLIGVWVEFLVDITLGDLFESAAPFLLDALCVVVTGLGIFLVATTGPPWVRAMAVLGSIFIWGVRHLGEQLKSGRP
jgi:hypothetical protein